MELMLTIVFVLVRLCRLFNLDGSKTVRPCQPYGQSTYLSRLVAVQGHQWRLLPHRTCGDPSRALYY